MGAGCFALKSATAVSKVSCTCVTHGDDIQQRVPHRRGRGHLPVVCTRTFTDFSIGCGTLYPASDTCGFLFSMYRTALPIVWSSSLSVNVFSYTDMPREPLRVPTSDSPAADLDADKKISPVAWH